MNILFGTRSVQLSAEQAELLRQRDQQDLELIERKKFVAEGGKVLESQGAECWVKYGVFHRDHGPAWKSEDKEYWYQNGKLHRTDGPAVVTKRGHKEWLQNGKHHRVDGPAIEYSDGKTEHWVNGQRIQQ